jgi:hypothetical protein
MQKVELKVFMCCPKCEEIVKEEIKYMGGKFLLASPLFFLFPSQVG